MQHVALIAIAFLASYETTAFCPLLNVRQVRRGCPTELFLQTNLQIPLLDFLDDSTSSTEEEDAILTPLPSSHLPDEVTTPFLYGMQVDRPVHKLLLEEATSSPLSLNTPPMYGHLVWKDKTSDSLVGAIGCTAEILVNAPTTEVLNRDIAKALETMAEEKAKGDSKAGNKNATPPSDTPASTILCRGGFRFVVKEVIKTIPYPFVVVDEIEDDADVDDSDMFAAISTYTDEEDEDDAKYSAMTGSELIQKTMLGIQSIVSQKLEDANSKQMSPLEKQILESSGMTVDPNAMEQARAEEMAAVWDVFQASLVDDVAIQDRKYAVAIMAAELADMNNEIRQQVLVTRDREERLRIVLKELDEIVGMARARKMVSQITDKLDGDDKDLKVGQPQLPPWAKTIVKGTRLEYFWNEEYGWVAGQVIEDPVTVVDEILLTILFADGETHTLPLSAEDKVRWRPPEN